ncbi:HNH endonuclease [Streptomyces sp. E5N298]|uniref:HNH endonuclease n=1 Tax=Streptomyces sp. E5N298 TaxID=1851983 RepID=UPI0019310AA0|nr:HNH endonuclease [Streptomyces sp. E5N298]
MPYPESLKLDFETLFAETIGHVDNRAMGLLIRGLAWASTHKRNHIPIGVMQACGADENPEDLAALQRAGFVGELSGRTFTLLPNAWLLCNVGRLPLPPAVRITVLARDSNRCVTCGSSSSLQIDHVFPVSLGGSDEIDNLRTLCQPCNSSKGARV